MRTAPVPAPSKHPWHRHSKPICISTGPCVPVAHGLCISQLLKTQTPNISPMWRTGGRGDGASGRELVSERMVFISLRCLLFHLSWSSCAVSGCLGRWGTAGLPRMGLQTLYITTAQPLMHINLVILEALGKLTRTLTRNLFETFWVSMSFNGKPSTTGRLFRSMSMSNFFASSQIRKNKKWTRKWNETLNSWVHLINHNSCLYFLNKFAHL